MACGDSLLQTQSDGRAAWLDGFERCTVRPSNKSCRQRYFWRTPRVKSTTGWPYSVDERVLRTLAKGSMTLDNAADLLPRRSSHSAANTRIECDNPCRLPFPNSTAVRWSPVWSWPTSNGECRFRRGNESREHDIDIIHSCSVRSCCIKYPTSRLDWQSVQSV